MQIYINENAKNILIALEKAGFQAMVVGGCVRDAVMGIHAHDWDITTNARPEQVMKIFPHVIPTGIEHGTVTVMVNTVGYEVTTFRSDGSSSDNRHPDKVEFVSTIFEDIARRDFTFNAMFAEKDGIVVDHFGGMEDIHNGLVRFIGIADHRIIEDAHRMMRAIRFASRFGFDIANDSWVAIIRNANLINFISRERIRDEIMNTICTEYSTNGIQMWHETGLLALILPAVESCYGVKQNNPHHIYNVGEHIAESVGSDDVRDKRVALAMLLHDIGKVTTKTTGEDGIDHFLGHGQVSARVCIDIMRGLRFDNSTIEMVHTLVLHHNDAIHPNGRSVRKWLNKIGLEAFNLLMQVRLADASAQNPDEYEASAIEVREILKVLAQVVEENQAFKVADLDIDGEILAGIGIPRSRVMGEILNEMMEMVISYPELNKREILIQMAKDFWVQGQ